MQLVTGYTGTPHVSAQDDSIRNVMLGEFGGRGVFPVLNEFEATAITANEVRVYSGYGINQGRLFKIDRNAYDSLTIENGTAGMKRADLIVARYARDEQTGIEGCELVVIKGTAGSTYVDPTYTTGDILQGALQDDMLMYRVKINGVAIEGIDELFTTYRSLIGGIEPVVDAQVDANFDSKLASYQARFENMITTDHASNVNQQTADHNTYTQMMNDDDSAFDTWFASIQSLIDEQTATRLANAIAKHDQDFAYVEATMTASKDYKEGEFLINGNYLYKANQSIATGTSIIVDTNVVRVSVGDILKYVSSGYIRTGQAQNTFAGQGATCEGTNTTASGNSSHAEGNSTSATADGAHSEGTGTTASGVQSHAEGINTEASGNVGSHAEGLFSVASGDYGSHAEGREAHAEGDSSHAEGYNTSATGEASHAEGNNTGASSYYAHAEGDSTLASGSASHAEGGGSQATGGTSHAEGNGTHATGEYSHSEGASTTASGSYSHAEGSHTVAGLGSHAEGYYTRATGDCAHSEGYYTEALSNYQHVGGKYNKRDSHNLYAMIIGNGTDDDDNSRNNALTLDWSGNLKAASYSNLSSRKYKENIKDMTEEEAKKLLELNPVSYDYKSDKLPDGQFGLIAEDVEKVMTYPLVYEHDEVDSIDYSKFVPALIKMVQIQQKEIDRLKELIEK